MASSGTSSPQTSLELGIELSVTTPSAFEASSQPEGPALHPMLLPLLPIPRQHQEHELIYPSLASLATGNGSMWGERVAVDVNQIPHSSDSENDDADETQLSVLHLFGKSAPLKRPRPGMCGDAPYRQRLSEASPSPRASDDEDGGGTRKKLRLSKEQSAFLEESFKKNSTLNPKQKQELAKKLNLRPRQVEVWFQNRRARTKLKQTEVDCELLRRCCKALTEENRRLQKELQELRVTRLASQHVYANDLRMPLPATMVSVCPSCEHVTSTVTTAVNSIADCNNATVASLLASISKHHHLKQERSAVG